MALGDSYTIGTSVEAAERFPEQLVGALGSAEPTLDLVANLGVNGYTSADLIREELPALDELQPEFATVLIGVNDVVQGVPRRDVRGQRRHDPRHAPRPPAGRPHRDRRHPGLHGHPGRRRLRRPAPAARRDRREQRRHGTALRGAGDRVRRHLRHLAAVPRDDRSLVADDGLHPSGAQYGLLGRAPRAGGGAPARRADPPAPGQCPDFSSWSRASLIPKWWAIS